MICQICNRPISEDLEYADKHHWIPKSKKGKDVGVIHKLCHNKIHSVFTEKELEQYYHTPERILEHEEIQKFVSWIKNKPEHFYVKTKDSTNRKKKRKRK